MKEKLNSFLLAIKRDLQPIAFALISSWMITLAGFTTISPIALIRVPTYADSIPLVPFILIFIALAAILYALNRFYFKKLLFITFPISFLAYGMVSVVLSANTADLRRFSALVFCALSLIVLILCINYVKTQKIPLPTKDISFKASVITVSVAFVLLSTYWIFLLWARTESFCAPCFDMGIFTQMYDNMVDPAHSFLPMTTCERGEYLSHFAVHFSPILYLLMPFCFIFEPIHVLVFAQILLVLSGVLPMFLICRQLKLSNTKTTIMSLLYLLYPVMSSGSFYDFHENAFLAPLILWTLYFSLRSRKRDTVLMFVFALLVLMVKEDAAIYVAFISLYIFFSQKKYLRGALMFAMTVAYFFFAIFMISQFGEEGNMLSSRYANIIGDEAGFTSLIKVFIVNPALYAIESLTADKLVYAINMLLPLAFLPLMTRKISRWLLIGPFFVLNLVTDYPYQHDLGFQYSFGSGALLVYLAAINLADLSSEPLFAPLETETETETESSESSAPQALPCESEADLSDAPILKETDACEEGIACDEPVAVAINVEKTSPRRRLITNLTALILIFAIFSTLFIQAGRAPAHFTYAARLFTETEIRDTVNDTLSRIDRDKSILASSMYLTHLYDADELYSTLQVFDSNNTIIIFTELVVLDLRPYISDSKKAEVWTNKYLLNGYEIIEEHEDIIRVLQRTEDSPPVGYSKYYLEYLKMKEREEQEKENGKLSDGEAEENLNEGENLNGEENANSPS